MLARALFALAGTIGLFCTSVLTPYSWAQPKRVLVQHAHFLNADGGVARSSMMLGSIDGNDVSVIFKAEKRPIVTAYQRRVHLKRT